MSHIRLSLPRGISTSTTNDDTFSRDLLRQFDKKRSRLHYELGFTSQEPSPESSMIMTPVSEYYNEEPVQLDETDDDDEPITNGQQQQQRYIPSHHTTSSKRSSSASELFRRSSAYLKSKFDLFKQNKPEEEITIDHSKQPKKLMMKTTISIPSTTAAKSTTSSFSPLLSTPTITQYPPKPLVYSPIEPIPNTSSHAKPLLHRISMPLLRVYNDTTTNLSRNKSITSFGRRRKSEPDNHSKKKLKRAKQQQQQQN